MKTYDNQYHEILWAYVNCIIDYSQLKEQIQTLNEKRVLEREVC